MIETIECRHESERARIGAGIRSQQLIVQKPHARRRAKGILIDPSQQFVRGTPDVADLSHQTIRDLALDAEVVLINKRRTKVDVYEIIARPQQGRESRGREVDVRGRW